MPDHTDAREALLREYRRRIDAYADAIAIYVKPGKHDESLWQKAEAAKHALDEWVTGAALAASEPEREPDAVALPLEAVRGLLQWHEEAGGSIQALTAIAALVRGAVEDAARTPDPAGVRGPERDPDPDGYGEDIGPSPLVARGRVIQIGRRPGDLDAHVRPNCLILRCEAGAGRGNAEPFQMQFNDEDAAILMRVASTAARTPDPAGIAALRRAVKDEGPGPALHRRIMKRHREEWPTLWAAIDDLLSSG